MSPSLKRLSKAFSWVDSFRELFPVSQSFSRYYENDRFGEGATRIDRQYNWGGVDTLEACYVGAAFSDHMGYIVKVKLPKTFSRLISPKFKPQFKSKPDVIKDPIFNSLLKEKMVEWNNVKEGGVDILLWWDLLVKPGVKKLLINRGKEIKQERLGALNLLLLRQSYLVRKVQHGEGGRLSELKQVQAAIQQWHAQECEKVKIHSRSEELNTPESVRTYHHELHSQHIKKSSILKLQTENGLLLGHEACTEYLENAVDDILTKPANLNQAAQDSLLQEVKPVFTKADNAMMKKMPDKEEVKASVISANANAAPGTGSQAQEKNLLT